MHEDDVGKGDGGSFEEITSRLWAGEFRGRGSCNSGRNRRVCGELQLHGAAPFPPKDSLHKYATAIIDEELLRSAPWGGGSPKYGDAPYVVYIRATVLKVFSVILVAFTL